MSGTLVMPVADNGDEHKPDAVRREVWVGAVGEPEGDGRAEAGGPRLRAADWRPGGVHLGRYLGLRRCRPHHRRRSCVRAQEHRRLMSNRIWLLYAVISLL